MKSLDQHSIHLKFQDFSRELAERKICPYTTASIANETFKIRSFSDSNFEAGDFLKTCIIETEKLRSELLANGLGKYRVTNILFDEWKSPKALVDWVHWILKVAYTSESIMFGKFIKGSTETTKRKGLRITPPCSFISIRETAGKVDYDFLDETYAEILKNSIPTSKDVLYEKFGYTTNEILLHNSKDAYQFLVKESGKFLHDNN